MRVLSKPLGLFALLLFVVVAMHGGNAHAASMDDTGPDFSYGTPNNNARYVLVKSPNTGDMSTMQLPVYFNTKPTSDVTLRIEDVVRGGSGAVQNNQFVEVIAGLNTVHETRERCDSACTIDIPWQVFHLDDGADGTLLYRAVVRFVLRNGDNRNPADSTYRNRIMFRLDVLPGQASGGVIGTATGNDSGYVNAIAGNPDSGTNYDYRIPFATPCTVTNNTVKTITMYDLDSGHADNAYANITVRVRNAANNNIIGVARSGSMGDQREYRLTMSFAPRGRYYLEVLNVNSINMVQYKMPYDTGNFSYECPSARLNARAQALVDGRVASRASIGQTITFRNWVVTSNTARTGTDTFDIRVDDTNSNIPHANASIPRNSRQINPDRNVPDNQYEISFVASSPGNYCRSTVIVNNSWPAYATIANRTAEECVRVTNGIGGCDGSIVPVGTISPGVPFSVQLQVSTDNYAGVSGAPTAATLNQFQVRVISVTATGAPLLGLPPGSAQSLSSVYAISNPFTNIRGSAGDYTITWNLYKNGAPFFANGNCSDVLKVTRKPYFEVRNGDANAAAGLASVSCAPNGTISAFNSSTLGGSNARIAAFAAQAITEFTSAGGIGQSKLLTFGNTPTTGQWGGNLKRYYCIDETMWSGTDSGPEATSTGTGLVGSATHYTEGDLYIRNNVEYADGFDINSVPLRRYIAGKNIYILNTVTRLDGIYAAKGKIYTCALGNPGPLYSANTTEMATQCEEQLTVNGAFISGGGIKLQRMFSTLGEQPAEIFNYSPEVWLQGIRPSNNSFADGFDSITSLPPVL